MQALWDGSDFEDDDYDALKDAPIDFHDYDWDIP
jgi:hypothetical protein